MVRAAEGDLDSGFGNNGVVTTHIGLMNQFSQGLKDVAIAADGKIVVAGYHDYSNFANPGQRAFYYVRVLEIPTPRWVLFDMIRFGAKLLPETELKSQERAYTSPIWYNPTV